MMVVELGHVLCGVESHKSAQGESHKGNDRIA